MNCPYCEHQESKVVDSRYIQEGIRRRRECLMCSLRFTTYEKVHSQLLNVIKKDLRKEPFSIEKLTKSITTACTKRPVSESQIEKITINIETDLLQNHGSEIKSSLIGQMVLDKLIQIDNVSYIRFSSVYKNFETEEGFVEVIDTIKTENSSMGKQQLQLFPEENIKKAKRKGDKTNDGTK